MAGHGAKPKERDWESIGKLYRLGQMSLRSIAKNHDISATTVLRKAQEYGWKREHSKEVLRRTEAALMCGSEINPNEEPTNADIDLAVKTNIAVIQSHRKSLKFQKDIGDQLAQELERNEPQTMMNKEGVVVEIPMTLSERSIILRNLAQAARAYIPLERQAFNLNGKVYEEETKKYIVDDQDEELDILATKLIMRYKKRHDS